MIIVALFCTALLACGGDVTKEEPVEEQPRMVEAQAEVEVTATVEVDLATLINDVAEFVGREVRVSGTVDHVCKHGGKRMFIMGENPEDRFKIEAGEAVAAFPVTLEGSEVIVRGIVAEKRIDDAYLDNWEAELETEEDSEEQPEVEGDDHHATTGKKIENLRRQITESENDFVSFYTIDCITFETLDS
jgi:hypothetical protein